MQLLRISTTPIQYEMRIERPRLKITQPQPSVTRTTEHASLQMQSKNVSMRMDSSEMRSSIGMKSPGEFATEVAQLGVKNIQEKTAQYVEMGHQMMQIHQNADLSDVAAQYFYPAMPMIETQFLPSVGPEISWEPGKVEMDYTPAKLVNEWHVMKNTMEYIPGGISFNIVQYPSVNVEYLGEPIYAPPSANPNYEE